MLVKVKPEELGSKFSTERDGGDLAVFIGLSTSCADGYKCLEHYTAHRNA